LGFCDSGRHIQVLLRIGWELTGNVGSVRIGLALTGPG
jgi:hypothetical protein